jgi:hypothetical protein
MFGNLQEQGDHPNSFDFFSGFQDDAEIVHVVDFLDAGFDADFTYGDALITLPLVLVGHSNMTMFHESFLLSVGDADLERSDGRIEYFDSRTLKNHAGTDISRAPGLHEK